MSTTRHLHVAALLVAATLLAAPLARADKPKLHLHRVDTQEYPLIRTNLTLVEADGRVITGKGPTDFKLVFDSNEQGNAVDAKPVDQLGNDPIFMVIIAQVSTVMHDVIDDEKRGIKQLAQAAADLKGSKVALIGYAQDVKRLAEMGKPEAIEGAAAGLAEDTEGTEVHLLDAIRMALDLLNAKGVPDKGRKMIVVFSDGIDVSGTDKKSFSELGKRANIANIVINTIGYSPFDPTKLRNFSELSRQTNGTDRTCKAAPDVAAQFSNTADEVRKQYVVLFQSVVAGDSKDHLIQIVSESGSGPAYSETVSAPCVPPPPPPEKPFWTKLWFWLLIIGLPLLVVVAFVVRMVANRAPAEAAPEAAAPVAPAAAGPAPAGNNRTMAFDLNMSEKGPAVGWIVGMTGRYTDKTFRLLPARTVIGTSTEADIVIEDAKVSRKHCEIRYDGLTYKIVDLGSTNGVVLNDKRTPSADLVDGDLFRLGGTEFKFKSVN